MNTMLMRRREGEREGKSKKGTADGKVVGTKGNEGTVDGKV